MTLSSIFIRFSERFLILLFSIILPCTVCIINSVDSFVNSEFSIDKVMDVFAGFGYKLTKISAFGSMVGSVDVIHGINWVPGEPPGQPTKQETPLF